MCTQNRHLNFNSTHCAPCPSLLLAPLAHVFLLTYSMRDVHVVHCMWPNTLSAIFALLLAFWLLSLFIDINTEGATYQGPDILERHFFSHESHLSKMLGTWFLRFLQQGCLPLNYKNTIHINKSGIKMFLNCKNIEKMSSQCFFWWSKFSYCTLK